MITTAHHEDDVDNNIVVEYDDEDPEMEELLQVSADSHDLRYEEEDRTDGDDYGGMSHELYNNIVEFKKNGTYPNTLNSRQDRSALSHWRARCTRYVMAQDNETLLYYNPASSVSDTAKVVVKKGEVRRVLERVHELIGHLGQKRTQMAVLKRLHWRSVRQDVKNYILNCDFCNQKKLEGKKILKAPVDISSENFGINVEARSGSNVPEGERLHISLNGYNEHEVQAAAMTRMTSYTFKETASEIRGGRYGRAIKPEFLAPGSSTSFRRQPYIRRSRYTPYSASYILPYTPKGPKEDPEFIIYNPSRADSNIYPVGKYEEYEVEETIVEDTRHLGQHGQEQIHEDVIQTDDLVNVDNRPELQSQVKEESHMIVYETQHSQKRVSATRDVILKQNRRTRFNRQTTGLAGRFSATTTETERIDIGAHSTDLFTSLEAVQNRAELVGVAPILLMPSVDPEVISLQKEVLSRQLRIQELQEKILQSQLESMRIPIARYEEIDPQGENIQLLEDNGTVIEDLNVMDSGDDEEIMKQYGAS